MQFNFENKKRRMSKNKFEKKLYTFMLYFQLNNMVFVFKWNTNTNTNMYT